ncbi:MAG: hypothetical protein AB7O48_16830 [Cyclobacteriaceae bacterium]
MNDTNDFIDPNFPELSKLRFLQRMNGYARIQKWLMVANIVAWSAAAYIITKSLSV